MKRTQTDIIGPAAFQAHKVTHNIDDVGSVKYALYCLAIDFLHQCKITNIFVSDDGFVIK